MRLRTALTRTRVSATLRSGLWATARVTLRSRAEEKGNLEIMGKDGRIEKGGGDIKIKDDLDVMGKDKYIGKGGRQPQDQGQT